MGNGEWDDSGEWEIEMGIWKKKIKKIYFFLIENKENKLKNEIENK